MQKILHADTHELNKMKAEFNMRQKEREQVKPQQKPEPEQTDDENFDQDTDAPLKPPQSNQWHTSQQVGYTPTKPSKPNKNDDVTDVEPKPNKPLALGNSLKEATSMLKAGDEIMWKPLNAKMIPIAATVIAVNAEKLKIKIYSPRMIKMRNGNDTMVVDLAGSEIIPKQTTIESAIQAGRQVDAKGRTQAQWVDLVMKKFPNARIAQGRGPFSKTTATLPGGRQIVWTPTMPDTINAVSKPKMSEGSDNPYGYRKGQTVKLDNGQQGRVIDIFDDSIEVLLVGGRTVTVDFRDAQVIGEQGVAEGVEQPKEAFQAIQKLQRFAQDNPDFTLQQIDNLPSRGNPIKPMFANANLAIDTLIQAYKTRKEPGNAEFLKQLKDEINYFLTDRTASQDPTTLGDLLTGKLGKINFQQGVAEEKTRLDPKCWDGYKKQGTKMKGDTRVNNCVPKESAIMKGLVDENRQGDK
jgi:preprotein translocase subunit YajC